MAENVLLPEDLAIPCNPYDEPFSRWKPQICGASARDFADPSLVAVTAKEALPQGSFVHDENLTVPRPPLVRMTVRRRGGRFVPPASQNQAGCDLDVAISESIPILAL